MKKQINRALLILLFAFLTACQSSKPEQLVTWGYITGDPILDAGQEGNFYPQIVHENEGAITP
ncbi:MAG: hypothetical protein PSN04_09380 [Methyloprofundus sp.]|nr:hypothetical protein [Methyloprofundus sp.]